MPSTVAEHDFGPPQANYPAQMVIWTRIGAADQVAAEVPYALRPNDPQVLQADAPPDKWDLQGSVDAALEDLFLSLAGLSLLIGASLAVWIVIAVALTKQWTAILDPRAALIAPAVGAVTGLLAGLYPALRASRIEPLEALRS